jgi:3',5'-cyclic AMP phosphodiesterase CpdA
MLNSPEVEFMKIAQFSDTHMLAPAADHNATQLRADWLRETVADINGQRPDAVIFTGDTTQTGHPEEYAILFEILATLNAPLYVIPGNRDDSAALRRACGDREHLRQSDKYFHYVVEDLDVRLIGIDSTDHGERMGVFCSERQTWLDAVLRKGRDRPTLLFIHHPPFDVDDHYVGGYRRADEAVALTDIIGRNSQVKGLLCGHVHCPVNREWNGTRVVVTPSIAVDLRKGVDESDAKERPIYMLHEVSGAAELTSQLRVVGAEM